MIRYKLVKTSSWLNLDLTAQKLNKDIALATSFVKQIASGNLDVFTEEDISNHDLQRSLMNMRDQMKKYSLDEKQRNWVNEGLARFVQILRSRNGEERQQLADNIIKNLVTYLNANQGALYALNDDNPNDTFIEMEACYAYHRKKYLHKRIELGEGLVGQVALEKTTLYMKDVPKDFVKITSGLGEAVPTNVLIVPLKLDEQVFGIAEIASFQLLQPFEIEFVERLGESIASSIAAVKNNERTKNLLRETQLQAEQLKSQEEEVRQNLEELSATQEAMQRAMVEVETKEAYISQILNTSKDLIYTVDRSYQMVMWNGTFAREAERLSIKLEKGMDAFGWSRTDRKKLVSLYERVFNGETFEMTYETNLSGKTSHFLSVYAPLRSPSGEIVQAGVYARDVTPIVEAQQEAARLLRGAQMQAEELKAQEEELRQNMEELAATKDAMQRAMVELEIKEAYALEIINATDDLIYTVDKEFRFVSWNKSFAKLAEENKLRLEKYMVAFEWLPHYKASLEPYWSRALKGETFHIQWENERDGKKDCYHSIYAPVRSKNGEVIEAVVFAKNIVDLVEAQKKTEQLLQEAQQQTEQLKAQEEELRQNMEELAAAQEQMAAQHKMLEESEQTIRTIMDSSPFGIIRVNRNGEFLLHNDYGRQLLGINNDTHAVHFDSVFKALKLEKLNAGDKKRTKVFPIQGNPFMAELIISSLQDDFLFFLRDVTKEIQQQHELVKSLEHAELLKQTLREKEYSQKKHESKENKEQHNGTNKR